MKSHLILCNLVGALVALASLLPSAAQVTVFQADFQASAVAANTTVDNLDLGTPIGSWADLMETNVNVYGNAGATQKALCPDSNGNGGYSLLAIGTNSVLLRSNVTVTVKLARGRSGSPGTGRSFQLIGCDALNNTNFDLQVFANENQIAGTNGALYWNNNGAYTNWFGTNYSVAGDIRNLSISPTGYNPASLSALTIQCQSNGYIVTLDRLNNGSVTWRSSLLPYNSSATTLSRILVSGGNGAGQWLDDLVVSGVPGSDAVSAVPAAITIQTEDQRQLITDWGYDIKQSGKAAALTPAVAQDLFVTDRMSILRIPIYGDIVRPAHPASGTVIGSHYTDMLTAMTNARAANSNVLLFASKKLEGQDSFPAWVKDANGVLPGPYAELVADYLQFLHTNGFTVDVLGVDNEEDYNEGKITPARYTEIIDNLRALTVTRGFPMPARLIAPEDYGPEDTWMNTLVNEGWGDRCDIVGTHYYPKWRPLTRLRNLYNNGAPRPLWNSEAHWNNIFGDVIDNAEAGLAAMFDCTDTGVSAFSWWAYTRTGIKGGLEQGFTSSTARSRPLPTRVGNSTSTSLGRLFARSYRSGTNLVVWLVNNTSTNFAPGTINLDRGALVGNAEFQQWNPAFAISGSTNPVTSTSLQVALPPRTITRVSFPYLPPGPDALYVLDGNALDSSGAGNHGTAFNSPTYVPGRVGSQAMQFNGLNQYVQIPRSIGGATNFSMAFWLRTTSTGGSGNQWWNGAGLVDGEVAGAVNDFGVALLNGSIAFGIGNPDTTLQSATTVNDGNWHHVAVTRNGFDGELRIYLNGVLNAVTNTGPKGPRTAPSDLRLGSLQTGAAGKFYDGALDDVRLYNGLLEETRITALASAPLPNTPPVLAPLPNQTLIAGQTLNLTNSATDAETPPQVLTFAVQPVVPGVSFDTNSGVLNWRPAIAQSPSTNLFSIIVSDDGTPSLSATQQFAVTVLPPSAPQLTAPGVGASQFHLTITGDAGPDYTVQTSTNLVDWTSLRTITPATLPVILNLPLTNAASRQFYRLQLGP
jgi:O-glycosyl hydrolase